MAGPQTLQLSLLLLLGEVGHRRGAVRADRPTSVAELPVGCLNYGYQYHPAMKNVTNPATEVSVLMCQMRCAATAGCAYFAFWEKNQKCWLGGREAVLRISASQGAISGPARCDEESVTCNEIPSENFPGVRASASRQAWQTGQQPSNLLCWPRKKNHFPATCEYQTAIVLQDTRMGWPGRCEGMMQITNLGEQETCQTRCFGSALCAVWAVDNYTSNTGELTCWQGVFGSNCYSSRVGSGLLGASPGTLFRAQRVMHGTFRVLKNIANMEVHNLTRAFGIKQHRNWKKGAKACRMTCLSYLLCQYWQYSHIFGCFVEDVMSASVAYPLVAGQGVSVGTPRAESMLVGEYIQHTCKEGTVVPLPTDPPEVDESATPPPRKRRHGPRYGELGYGSTGSSDVVAGPVIKVPTPPPDSPSRQRSPPVEDLVEPPMSFPLWVWGLICAAAALCLGVIGAVIAMSCSDSGKKGSEGGAGGGGGGRSGRKGKLPRTSGSASNQSEQQTLLSQQAQAPHASWQHQQQYVEQQQQQQQLAHQSMMMNAYQAGLQNYHHQQWPGHHQQMQSFPGGFGGPQYPPEAMASAGVGHGY